MYSAAATACINSIGAIVEKHNKILFREEKRHYVTDQRRI